MSTKIAFFLTSTRAAMLINSNRSDGIVVFEKVNANS